MTRPNITSGEWGIIRIGKRVFIETDCSLIADMQAEEAVDPADVEADAKAIAAVPALLEALELIHSNAAESPEWIRERTTKVLTLAGYTF